MGNLLKELKRRNVFKVAIAFLMLSWLILQLVDVLTPILALPESFARVVFVALLILFPITLIISWAFELTPDGIKKSEDVDEEHSIRQTTGQKINYIIIGFLILVIGFQYWGDDEVPVLNTALANTIAVMPFADMSAGGDQEYFGDGMAEEILNVIVSIDDLDVTSRTTAFSLKEENLSIPEIAERLNVNYILEGSIRSDGNNVRVTAQLIDVANDTHLWSDTYDRELTSIFAIQDEISLAIADALKVELLGDMIGDVPTQSMEAYELILQARQLLYVPNISVSLRVRDLANQALILDSSYAEGWAILSASYNYSRSYNGTEFNRNEINRISTQAKEAAEKSIDLKPTAAAWTQKGFNHLMNFEWADAEEALHKATTLDPKDTISWTILGWYYLNVGTVDDAISAYTVAVDVNPSYGDAVSGLARSLLVKGELVQSRTQAEKAVDLGYTLSNFDLSVISLIEGKKEEVAEGFKSADLFFDMATDENIDLYVDGYFDPVLRAEYQALLPDYSKTTSVSEPSGALLLLNGENFINFYQTERQFFAYRLFLPPFRPMLNQPAVKDFFVEIGIVDYWRETKWPFFCRPLGDDDFECGEF